MESGDLQKRCVKFLNIPPTVTNVGRYLDGDNEIYKCNLETGDVVYIVLLKSTAGWSWFMFMHQIRKYIDILLLLAFK